MLARRQRQRSGIQRAVEREWPKHERWVRSSFVCYAFKADGANCSGKIQCCHWRSAANSGTGVKPHSWFCFPGCFHHHIEVQHQEGQKAAERKYGVDLQKEALQLARVSPDRDIRLAMREAGL